jgi:hypothetical protein
LGRPLGENQASCGIPTATPGINKYSPLDSLTPCPTKKKRKKEMNNKQGTKKEHAAKGAGCCKHTGEGGKSKELISGQTFSKKRLVLPVFDSGQVIS